MKTLDTFGVSVCIPAYNAAPYIEECLDSVVAQTWFEHNNYEILVGVDGCQHTLNKLLEIKDKYNNLRIFEMDSNKGCYITFNTIIKEAKYDYVLTFGADDIMHADMVSTMIKGIGSNDIVRCKCQNFIDGDINNKGAVLDCSGVTLVKKDIFLKFGIYRDWICGADSEFLERTRKFTKQVILQDVLLDRRIGEYNLTRRQDTGNTSLLRKQYIEFIKNSVYKSEKDAIITMVTNSHKKPIDTKTEIKNYEKSVDVYMASLWRSGFVVDSIQSVLTPELKTLTVCLNNYTDEQFDFVKSKVSDKRVKFVRCNNEKGSNEKLHFISDGTARYIACIDDDLIYDKNHLSNLISKCEIYDAAVSLHGGVIRYFKDHSYYKNREVYACKNSLQTDKCVDIIGNGVSLYKREWLTKEEWVKLYDDAPCISMDDIIVSCALNKKGIMAYVIAHSNSAVTHKKIEDGEIYVHNTYVNNDSFQMQYIRDNYQRMFGGFGDSRAVRLAKRLYPNCEIWESNGFVYVKKGRQQKRFRI